MRLLLLAASLLLGGCSPEVSSSATSSRPGGSLLYEVDLDRVRTLGWAPSDSSDGEALRASGRLVERRLKAFDLGLEVEVDPAARTLVVGPTDLLAYATEELVDRALQSLGLVEILVEASDSDFRGQLVLAEERERFASWRAKNPGASVHQYNALPADEGGPHALLLWAPGEAEPGGTEGMIPLLLPDRPSMTFGAKHMDSVMDWSPFGTSGAIRFELDEARSVDFERFAASVGERPFAVVFQEGVVLAPRSEQGWWGSSLVLEGLETVDVNAIRNAVSNLGPLARY